MLSLDEKSQALDRTAPMLPVRPGLPDRQTDDYVRHGTTTLFAALEVVTGRVTDACMPRHRHQEFLRFLNQVAKAYPGCPLSNYQNGTGQGISLPSGRILSTCW